MLQGLQKTLLLQGSINSLHNGNVALINELVPSHHHPPHLMRTHITPLLLWHRVPCAQASGSLPTSAAMARSLTTDG